MGEGGAQAPEDAASVLPAPAPARAGAFFDISSAASHAATSISMPKWTLGSAKKPRGSFRLQALWKAFQ
jgi:hypothetical protein